MNLFTLFSEGSVIATWEVQFAEDITSVEQNNIMNALQTQMNNGTFGGESVTNYASGM